MVFHLRSDTGVYDVDEVVKLHLCSWRLHDPDEVSLQVLLEVCPLVFVLFHEHTKNDVEVQTFCFLALRVLHPLRQPPHLQLPFLGLTARSLDGRDDGRCTLVVVLRAHVGHAFGTFKEGLSVLVEQTEAVEVELLGKDVVRRDVLVF